MPETPVLDRVLFSQEQLAARVEELERCLGCAGCARSADCPERGKAAQTLREERNENEDL